RQGVKRCPSNGRLLENKTERQTVSSTRWEQEPGALPVKRSEALPDQRSVPLLTVIEHELGHILGFDPSDPGYESHLRSMDGAQYFVGRGFAAQVVSGGELDPNVYPNDVMAETLALGVRKLPAAIEMQVIATLWGHDVASPGQPSG